MKQSNESLNVAFHFTQSTAEESYRCDCGQLFKKLYVGCNTTFDGSDQINSIDHTIKWKCCLC
jgi:hypothetical protein